jgi:hypothetical protein
MIKMKASLLMVSVSIPQHIPAHRPFTVHIEPPKPLLLKVRNSVRIEVVNNCDGITLGRGTCTVLKGHDKYDFEAILPPYKTLSTVIRSNNKFGSTRCCIVYELTKTSSPTTLLWWGYRVFLAVQVFIRPFSNKNKATAILFKLNDHAFNGGQSDISALHKDILQYSMHRPHRAAVWNLGGQALSLNPEFTFKDVPASVRVVLENSHLSIEHDPIFHRIGAFA